MSQASSDFDDDFGGAMIEADGDEGVEMPMVAPPPAYRKQGFSIYTVMLILSFVFLTIASIMFFIDAGKY